MKCALCGKGEAERFVFLRGDDPHDPSPVCSMCYDDLQMAPPPPDYAKIERKWLASITGGNDD